jgi:RNA polymerase sigma-70 factor (ECF subfamily)
MYRSEFSYVWKTLRRLGAPPQDIEDLVHDLFVVVHRHLADYDAARPVRPWLFGIAVRVVADFRRSPRSAREVLGETAEPVDGAPTPHEHMEATEARALLMKALDGLDLDRRAVFVMHELDDIPMPEIAGTLAIPLNTAYSRLRLARADVAAAIQRVRAGERSHHA